MYRTYIFAAVIFPFLTGPVRADSILGTWSRDNGDAKVKFDTCSDAICGTIVALKSGAESEVKIGQLVFFDMKPDGTNSWSGKAVSPKDGSTFSGKISVNEDSLITAGCLAGGLLCKSIHWIRDK